MAMHGARRREGRGRGLGRPRAVRLGAGPVGLAMLAVGLSLHPGLVGAGAAADEPSASALSVEVEAGLLTVKVRDARLADVLRLIGERAGLRVSVEDAADSRVSAAFADVPLEQGIRRLVRGDGVVLVYAASREGAGEPALAEIRVYGVRAGLGPVRGGPAEVGPARTTASAAPAASDRAARLKAVAALARPGDEGAALALARIVAEERDSAVRATAVRTLGEVGGARALEAVQTALGDQDRSVRRPAVQAYRKLAGAQSVPVLGGLVRQDPDPLVRREAVWALRTLRTREALEAVAPAAADPSELVRQAVAQPPLPGP